MNWKRVAASASLPVAAALLLDHARRYDFTCDDAFITLRYARNLATLGAPVYNPGERVEGYTNFLWMVLTAAGIRLGFDAVRVVKVLGALSGIGLLAAASYLWLTLRPGRWLGAGFVALALAVSAPVAAWTLGGLETPLFAALVTFGIALAARCARELRRPTALVAGLVFALATLTRPEGALFFGLAFIVVSVATVRSRRDVVGMLAMAVPYVAIVGTYVAWRWHYYGYPLPNTFYLKTSGGRAQLWGRGGLYVAFAARELGIWFVALVAVALATPDRSDGNEPAEVTRTRRAMLWFARVLVPIFVLYVASVGGDFLDLYRFFVPLFPLIFVVIANAGLRVILAFAAPRARLAVGGILALAVLSLHAVTQARTGSRALLVDEPDRVDLGIEPLGWTRLYALRWAAMGRWLRDNGHPDEWMASGAAGALAYYSGLHNLDTLGLCDAFVSHQGDVLGDRPGHQRFAPRWYILSKNPVFVLLGDHIISDDSAALEADADWNDYDYDWVEVRLDERYGAPEPFYHRLLVRRDRREQIAGNPEVRERHINR